MPVKLPGYPVSNQLQSCIMNKQDVRDVRPVLTQVTMLLLLWLLTSTDLLPYLMLASRTGGCQVSSTVVDHKYIVHYNGVFTIPAVVVSPSVPF